MKKARQIRKHSVYKMNTKAVLLFIFLLSTQTFTQWVSNYWGNNNYDSQVLNSKGLAVASDKYNNCFVTGYTVNSVTGSDIILIKYNEAGDTLYSRTYTGTGEGDDRAFGIAVDEYDNVYITGQVYMSGLGLELITIKYDNAGNLLWAKTYGETDQNLNDAGLALTIDSYNRAYVTGYVTGLDGFKKIVTIRFNQNGSLAWIKTEDSQGGMDCEGFGIAVDESDNVYVSGYTATVNNSSGKDIVVIKYAQNGNEKWVRTYDGSSNQDDAAYGIAVDGNRIYVTGYTTISGDNTDVILIRLSSSGSVNWVKTFDEGGGASTDRAFGIAVDEDSRIYITGESSSDNQGRNFLTLKYNASGMRLWETVYNGPGNGDDYSNAIGITGNNKVVVTGASYGTYQNYDYATVKFNKNNGNINSVSRYSLSGNTNDIAKDLEVSDENTIFVTGYSELIIDNKSSNTAISTLMIKDESNELNTGTINPDKFCLYQNYPNPFNPATTIKFSIAEDSFVKLVIYDALGRSIDKIVNNDLKAGIYSISYTNSNLSSGIYFYELSAGSYKDVKKMTLIK